MQTPSYDLPRRIPVVVGYAIIISLLYSAQVHTELGLIQLELTDDALGLENVEAHEGQGVARGRLSKSQDVKLPLLRCILNMHVIPSYTFCTWLL